MLNRTDTPAFNPIQASKLPKVDLKVFQNQIPLYSMGFASQDVIKLELVFNAGSGFEHKNGVSGLFSKMILGGTSTRTSSAIMEGFDQYGGFIEVSARVERLHIILHGLRKFLDKYLVLIQDILENCIFPEDELEMQRKITLQNLKMSMEKSSFLASRSVKRLIFGVNNPYGRVQDKESIEGVSREDLSSFYSDFVKGKAFKIFASGNIKQNEIDLLEQSFGKERYEVVKELEVIFDPFEPKNEIVVLGDKMQSTIRLGKPVFNRTHPDYFPMAVTNTLFGGYFGSRLMKNIREDKGFTYGISSSINPMKDFGYMLIGADVVKENTVDTLTEIEKEMNILRSEKVTEGELETVKNYMCGSFAGSITTAFELMEKHKRMILAELPSDYYDSFIDNIRAVNTNQVLEMAQKYLEYSSLSEIVVGERI